MITETKPTRHKNIKVLVVLKSEVRATLTKIIRNKAARPDERL